MVQKLADQEGSLTNVRAKWLLKGYSKWMDSDGCARERLANDCKACRLKKNYFKKGEAGTARIYFTVPEPIRGEKG